MLCAALLAARLQPSAPCTDPFFASAWSTTCQAATPTTNWSNCRNFSRIVPPMIIGDPFFGDNASSIVPRLIHGYAANSSGTVEDDGKVWPW